MNVKNIFKISLTVAVFVVIVGVGVRGKQTNTVSDASFGWKFPVAKLPSTETDKKLIAYSDIRDPGGIPQGLPIRFKIPIIGVDSAIEDAYITTDGRMDVPQGSVNVAWFALGPHPGKEGSAVIGGHFGIDSGVPKVFYDLDKLKAGDKVYVVDDNGDTLSFVVRSIKLFDRSADATEVFTSGDGLSHLNIITCEGVWNRVNDSYPQRRVVFTDAIPEEGAVAVANPKVGTEKDTHVPTISEISTPEELIVTPNTPENSSVSPRILIASAKSLYATPIDGLITSLLLISIVFIAFKIVRR